MPRATSPGPGILRRGGLVLASVSVLVAAYAVLAHAVDDPNLLPAPRALVSTAASLLTGRPPAPDAHAHHTGHVAHVVRNAATLPRALAASALRVLVGVAAGGLLGVLAGLVMGWSRRVDDYLHPVYVLIRSVPPLALVSYVMLWLGHGEGHRLVPIVYAVFTAVVIPTYHGVRDVALVYARAARALGAGRRLTLTRVVLPAASPFVVAALRYGLMIAWMTTVGVEMLMGEDGVGQLLVGGGLWASRLEIGVDPAAVMVGILGLAAVAWAMDLAARLAGARLTSWTTAAPG